MEEFRFQLTLTGSADDRIDAVEAAARAHFASVLPEPFVVSDSAFLVNARTGGSRSSTACRWVARAYTSAST